ncbi:hypothetical protein [Solitalea canadensis]|nr:hypothetical protein [Solitalea canadensis]
MKKTRQGIGPISMVTDKHAKNSFSRVDELEKVVSNIRGSILEKAGKDVSKAELLKELKVKLTNYEGLHQPACRVAITNFMIKETKELCGVVLSEEELESVWETLLR